MDTRHKLSLIYKIVFGGLLFAVLYHWVLMGGILHRGYPQNSFLFNSDWLFSDFYETVQVNRNLNPYMEPAVLKSAYPPLANMAAYAFGNAMLLRPTDWFLLLSLLAAVLAAALFSPRKTFAQIAANSALALFSYPFIYLITRGNLELVSLIFVMVFAACYMKKHYGWAAFFIACAAATKVYPALLILLFIADKKYRHAIAPQSALADWPFFTAALPPTLRRQRQILRRTITIIC